MASRAMSEPVSVSIIVVAPFMKSRDCYCISASRYQGHEGSVTSQPYIRVIRHDGFSTASDGEVPKEA
jgi:hypothetical protein